MLDVGAGVGVAGLCLLARVPEHQADRSRDRRRALRARRQECRAERFRDKFNAVTADVTAPGKSLRAVGLLNESYDQVIANPPFHAEGQ